MKQHTFNEAAGTIFLIIGLLHLFRIFNGWESVIGGWSVPMGLSWAVVFIASYFALHAINLAKRK